MTTENYTENGEITFDTETKEYTVWDETYSNSICVTSYPKVAEAALQIYGDHYLDVEGPDLFYLQDSRQCVGNDLLFWAKDGRGYTSDISKAHVYIKEQAVGQHNARHTDIPWPKQYIDEHTRPAVDHQYVDRDVALQGTGIVIKAENQL